MKKLSASIVITLFSVLYSFAQGPCLPQGITFTTQEEIDNFQENYPYCTEIEGDVTIDGGDITNLYGLNVITSIIFGDLEIQNCGNLINLEGLENLTYIGGGLSLEHNWDLISLAGLESLISIGGSLSIYNNDALTNLTGLENLISVGGGLWIEHNYSMTSLIGLENMTFMGGDLSIVFNFNLAGLTGLESLASIGGGLSIEDNFTLSSLEGLEGLTFVGDDLIIENNDDLTSLIGLGNIDPGSITNLIIKDNQLLSECDVQSICDYLASSTGTYEIHSNASGCNSHCEVREACGMPHPCLCEGIAFTTQEEIDNFQLNYPGCTEIGGDVSIYTTNIYSLEGLNAVTRIWKDLSINNTSLTDLNGLGNLTTINGSFEIGSIYFYEPSGNPDLTSLEGLENLTSIGGDLGVYDNDNLAGLAGLQSLTSIGGDLDVGGASGPYGDLLFSFGNDTLASLEGLEGLASIGGSFRIVGNEALTSLTGLESLASIGGGLQIGIYSYYGQCVGNPVLTSLTGINGLTSIGEGISIVGNESMTNLTGLNGLTYIGGSISIIGNESMANLTGFENLTSIGGGLHIGINNFYQGYQGNPVLASLTGLNGLTSIGGGISIIGNESMTNLTGLNNVDPASIENLHISGNNLLSDCVVQSICEYLAAPNGTTEIHDNATGCNSSNQVWATCQTQDIEKQELKSITVHPNPTDNGSITITLDIRNNLQLTCFNIYGQQVHQQEICSEESVINVSTWPPGIYLAVVHEKGKPVASEKVVVR